MQSKKGVTGIVFFLEKKKPVFLLLHRVLNWQGFEFAKGGVEEGETDTAAVVREIIEETGLAKLKIRTRLKSGIEWVANGKKYVYSGFLVESKTKDVVLQTGSVIEHDSFKWVDKKKAMEILTHKENKELLKLAEKFLAGKETARVYAIAHGRVQGVFYRQFVFESAHAIGGITGYVKNLSDGRVEILAEGKKESLKELLESARKGPPKAVVEKLTEKWSKAKNEFEEFEIMH